MKLWLDDYRTAPDGWRWVKTVADAQLLLATGMVEIASLDHDLGACEACMGGKTPDEWLIETDFRTAPHCTHVGTGYDLCLWIVETGHWPQQKPNVHSQNEVGAARMRAVIDRWFGHPAQGPSTPIGA